MLNKNNEQATITFVMTQHCFAVFLEINKHQNLTRLTRPTDQRSAITFSTNHCPRLSIVQGPWAGISGDRRRPEPILVAPPIIDNELH